MNGLLRSLSLVWVNLVGGHFCGRGRGRRRRLGGRVGSEEKAREDVKDWRASLIAVLRSLSLVWTNLVGRHFLWKWEGKEK